MPFVDGKCPRCGSAIRVDDAQVAFYCNSCGERIAVEDAVAKAPARVKPNPAASEATTTVRSKPTASEPSRALGYTVAGTKPETARAADQPDPPGFAETLGAFIFCWFTAGATCAVVTWAGFPLVWGVAATKLSTGGFAGLAIAIIATVLFKNSGKLGRSLGLSLIAGIVIGVIVIFISPAVFQMRYG